MNWQLAPIGAYLYIPSAVLLLWSVLFIFLYVHLKRSVTQLFVWGVALAVLSVQPVINLIAPFSKFLACCLFWVVQSMSAGLLVAGLFNARGKREIRFLAKIHYAVLTAIAVFTLTILNPPVYWLATVYALQSAFVAVNAVLHACTRGKPVDAPVYIAFLIFAGSSAYCAYDLLATGSVHGYVWIATLNAVILSNTLSCTLLIRTATGASRAKSRLESLVENTSQGLAFLSAEGELLQVNGRMLEIFGVSGASPGSEIPKGIKECLEFILSRCSPERKTNDIAVDFDSLRAEGRDAGREGAAKLSVSVRRIGSAEDAQDGTFIQVEDVTDMKNTLNELMEKRYSMELMFRAAGACEYSVEGGRIHSASLFRALGYGFDSIDAYEFLELVHPQDRYKYNDAKAVTQPVQGGTFSAETRVRSAEGGFVWYFFSSRNERIDNRVLTLGMAINIDVHKRIESYAMQNDRLAAVGQLANGVAHDINNYLMTIQTSLGMIDASASETQKKKFTSYMQEAIANSTGMLKRLVSFSKGDEVEYVAVPMNSLLSTSKELLQRSLTKGMRLKYCCGAARDVILGNYYELQNIILNIGLNARDALPETGGEISIRSWVADTNPLKPGGCGWYCISVRDNGCGMSDEVQKRIFDPFFTTKPHGKGSGLGLFTAYGYIQRHGGTISVESAQGAGTEFTLAFPLTPEGEGGETGEQKEP